MMFEPTLLQYESPQIITKKATKDAIEESRKNAENMVLMSIDDLITEAASGGLEMLDILMPPRIAEDGGQFWYQRVSRTPASISDLYHLQQHLDSELLRQEAREIGLCDVRRGLYDQLFDELTRQEIVACPERGRLVKMVRREAELSLSAVLSCYESGLAYGIKKKVSASRTKSKLTCEVTRLLSKVSELNDLIQDLEPKAAEVREASMVKEEEKKREFAREEEGLEKEKRELLEQLVECISISLTEEVEEGEGV